MSLNQFETDEQRAEALLQWLRDNSGFLVLLIIICVGVFFGTHYYKTHKADSIAKGANSYGELYYKMQSSNEITEDDLDPLYQLDQSIYSTLASSVITQQYITDNRGEDAETLLYKAIENEKNEVLKDLLYYRLAVVQYNLAKYDDALNTLNSIVLESYDPLVQTLRGDVYLKQEKIDQARIAYQEALKGDYQSELTEYKLDMLGEMPSRAE